MEKLSIVIIFALLNLLLIIISAVFYKAGIQSKQKDSLKLSALIPSSIFGLLALIMGFTFSMAISRYEHKRELAVDEANAITTAYLRSKLLKEIPGTDIKKLYENYVDSRIRYYDENMSDELRIEGEEIQKKIWQHFQKVTVESKTIIESIYGTSLNQMIDLETSRNFALIKHLPHTIYIIILLIASIGFSVMNFERGHNGEEVHWGTFLFIALFSMMFTLIYDIDHAKEGFITIGQDALLQSGELIKSF